MIIKARKKDKKEIIPEILTRKEKLQKITRKSLHRKRLKEQAGVIQKQVFKKKLKGHEFNIFRKSDVFKSYVK